MKGDFEYMPIHSLNLIIYYFQIHYSLPTQWILYMVIYEAFFPWLIFGHICHSLTFAMSWEQWTQSNTGHLSVSNRLSLNMTQVIEIIIVQPRLVVLTFHLFGFLVWQTSFVKPCRLTYHVELRRPADPPTTALQEIGCHVNTLLVQCTNTGAFVNCVFHGNTFSST